MKIVLILGLALVALVSTASAGCKCDDDFSGFGTEPGKCGCCPWPCCCKCFETEECPTTTAPPCPCMDIAFIIDASGSIGSEDWALMLEFVSFLVVNVGDNLDKATCGDQINVGMITFATNATKHFDWTPSLSAPIMDTPLTHGLTNLAEGMELSINELFSQERDCVPFAIIMTDGKADIRAPDIPMVGAALRAATDDNVVCIGITSSISEEQLGQVCIDPSRQMSVLKFDELTTLLVDTIEATVDSMDMVTEAPDCVKTENCFCCCSPEQYWGAGGGFYGR